jgi:hypothetical protein
LFRAFLLLFLLMAAWSWLYPERYREWNLKLYERFRWMASPSRHDTMRTASASKLRFQSGLIVIYAAILLLVSFKFLH